MHDVHDAARSTLLAQASRLGVSNVSTFLPQDDGRSALTLQIDVERERVPVRIVLPFAFPFGEIEIFLESPDWHRFAHEDARGKICPRSDALSARDPARLVEAIEAAIEWLADARSGTLTAPTEPYELPAFPVENHDWLLLFDEEAADLARWKSHVGASGEVALRQHVGGWAIEQFRAADGSLVAQRRSIREPVNSANKRGISGQWVFVDRFSAVGHRAAHTWDDLRAVFPALETTMFKAWHESQGDVAVVLVGAPMPATWGGARTRIHWQPLVFQGYLAARTTTKANRRSQGRSCTGKHLRPTELWRTAAARLFAGRLPWARAEDVSRERLYVRSTASSRAFEAPLLLGCGALGCAMADILVRGGLPAIAVIDRDLLEYGNLCRHVLNGLVVGRNKAMSLGVHLQLISPSVRVSSVASTLPPLTKGDADRFVDELGRADLVIDASGDDEILDWLGNLDGDRRIASVWTNSDTSIGVGVLTGRGDGPSVAELRAHVREAIWTGAVPGVSSEFYTGPALIVPGTGCWHPTFRGSWGRIVGLGAALSEWLCEAARGSRDGRAVVFRFRHGTWQRARSWSVPATSPHADGA